MPTRGSPFSSEKRTGRAKKLREAHSETEEPPAKHTARSIVIDGAERKRAEKDLNQQKRELDRLADNTPDVIFRVDRNLQFVFANQKLSDLTGIQKEHFFGRTLLQLGFPKDLCICLGKKVREAFDCQAPCEFEFTFETREGPGCYHSRLVPETDTPGNVETVLGISHDITGIRRAEAAFREESALRESIENSLPSGIMAIDLEGRITHVNPAFCGMVGWSKEELIGAKPPHIYWPPEERERNMSALREVLSGKRPSGSLELRLRKKNGEYIDVLMMFSELKDARGNVIGWVRSFTDISELKGKEEEIRKLNMQLEQRVIDRTARLEAANELLRREIVEHGIDEETLRESEERLRALVMASSDVVYRMSANWSEMRRLHGREFIPDTEAPSTDWLKKYIHPDDQELVTSVIKEAILTKSIFELEHRVVRVDGSLGWMFSRAIPLLDANGDIVEWFGTASDVTERRRADELRKTLVGIHFILSSDMAQSEIMRNVLDESAKALNCDTAAIALKTDNSWTISYVYGFPQELVGTRMSDEEEPHAFLAMNTGEPVTIEDTYIDERVNLKHMKHYGIRSVLVVPILKGTVGLGVFFFNYHTSSMRFTPAHINFSRYLANAASLALQRWALIEDLRGRTQELERANAELGAFAHTVSHDLKNPLIAARGFCQRLAERQSERLDERGRHYLRRIDDACKAMNELIEGLLTFSKIGRTTIKRTLVDLSSLARLIAEELTAVDPERDASFVIEDGLKAVGDPTLLRAALQNLIGNAWKFTMKRQKTVIEFGASKIEGISSPVFFVRDNGCGFDMAFTEKVFKPFQRSHSSEEFPGTGIGLASAHRIVERHGGRIWAESELDQGTTFFFTVSPPSLRDAEN